MRIQLRQPALQNMLLEIQKAVNGKNDVIFKVLLAILAGGHILLEDMPGVGKTTLAIAISKTLSLSCKRIQFTPDVLPTDVTGFTMYQKQSDSFVFKKGSAFCNLLLADEINRTSSKTQSALLELMEEQAVTIDGTTYALPDPHIVIATQNPITCVGTQRLPESQMDRFLVRLSLGYPSAEHEVALLKARQTSNPLDEIVPVADAEELLNMRREVEEIYVNDSIYYYVVSLIQATRNHPDIRLGISPRGSLALMQMAKACAYAQGRDYLLPDDVTFVCSDVFCHRLSLHGTDDSLEQTQRIVQEILKSVPVPDAE
ncbi:MAG: MoxR family ATPase [Oscillospiraceae bacterium]|nr:MoxR family ATPase [Oscillospiraceae bacterium]